jgi:ABC-type transport system involved in cytochrome bd biosynthesis fused ATPase/permease subunit
MFDASLLVVAHRIATIIDFDKVLVLDAGEVVEYDTPLNLLDKEGSAFASLCRKSGEWDVLKGMAEKAALARGEAGKGKGRK